MQHHLKHLRQLKSPEVQFVHQCSLKCWNTCLCFLTLWRYICLTSKVGCVSQTCFFLRCHSWTSSDLTPGAHVGTISCYSCSLAEHTPHLFLVCTLSLDKYSFHETPILRFISLRFRFKFRSSYSPIIVSEYRSKVAWIMTARYRCHLIWITGLLSFKPMVESRIKNKFSSSYFTPLQKC